MQQYNTGAHRSIGNLSPYEVFFGRKPNFFEPSFVDEIDDTEHFEEKEHLQHLAESEEIRRKAEISSKKAEDTMIKRNKRKYPPAEYELEEDVIVKNIYTGKKIKGTKIYSGVIKERKEDRYKVKYDKDGKTDTAWFPVSQITSKTKQLENEKQSIKKSKIKKAFKTNFHIGTIKENTEPIPKSSAEPSSSKAPKISEDSRYKLRKNRVSSYAGRDVKYGQNISEAIRRSKLDVKRHQNTTALDHLVAERGLRTVSISGDGNCFFRAIAHQIYGDSSSHQTVRARAVEEVINHPELFHEFLDDGDIDEFVDLLSKNNEWADHLAIQAVSDAYGITVEIINSNQRQFGGTRIIDPRGVTRSHRHVILAHIEQLHFMSTEPSIPFPTTSWGGTFERKSMTNTCPVDGPLSWLMLSMSYFPTLMTLIETYKLVEIINVFNLFKSGKHIQGKFQWLKKFADATLVDSNCHGSEADLFFEPISRTELAAIKYHKICNNSNCQKKSVRKGSIKVNKSMVSLKDRLERAGHAIKSKCSDCSTGTVTTSMPKLPPIIIVPHDCLDINDEIPTIISINGIVFVLLLITLYEKSTDHFTSIFRFNNRFWIEYDGLQKKKKETIVMQPKLCFTRIRSMVYAKLNLLDSSEPFVEDFIRNSNEESLGESSRDVNCSRSKKEEETIKTKNIKGM